MMLKKRQKRSVIEAGGKAYNLLRAAQFGVTIPLSWVLPVDVYRQFIKQNEIQSRIDDFESTFRENRTQGDWKQTINEIHEFVRNGAFESSQTRLFDQILKEASANNTERLAVRSSGINEDSHTHSFAGMFRSVLDVPLNREAVQSAVKTVWASQWTERLVQYHVRNHLDLHDDGMAVLIQAMIPADYSGVCFTKSATAVEGRDALSVEYVTGVSDSLVGGKQTPEQAVYDREKKCWINLDETKRPMLEKVAAVALKLESRFKQQLDIEWACAGDTIYILQVRPITTADSDTNAVIWSDENVGEVIPDIVTPLSWSILEPITNRAFVRFLKAAGLPSRNMDHLFGLYRGKVYFNHTLFNRSLQKLYISNHLRLLKESGARSLVRFVANSFAIARVIIKIVLLNFTLPHNISVHLRQFERKLLPFRNSPSRDQIETSLQKISGIVQLHERTMALHVAGTIWGELFYQLLDKWTRRLSRRSQDYSAEHLLTGTGESESAGSGRALWQLAQKVKQNASLRTLFLEESTENVIRRLEAFPEYQDVLSFFNRYGYGALHEFELFYPRWDEDWTYIIETVRNYLQTDDDYNPVEKEKRLREQQARILRDIKNDMPGPFRWIKTALFNLLYKKALFYNTRRENLKQALLKAHYELKKHIMDLADVLKNNRQIERDMDIFFLTLSECKSILLNNSREPHAECKQIIEERKQARAENMQYDHPPKVKQIGDDWIPLHSSDRRADGAIKGIPCSGGVIEGKVRVITEESDLADLQTGEILVTRSTNPGYTPLFVLAAGVITEIGGALSHGAIIAREYGIPMAAAVPDICERLSTGDVVRLNGYSGEVIIMKEEERNHGENIISTQ